MDERERQHDKQLLLRCLKSDGVYEPPSWYVQLQASMLLRIPPWLVDVNDPVQRTWLERIKLVSDVEREVTADFKLRMRANDR